MLRQLVYVSTAHDVGREEIEAILQSCCRNNALRSVTGLLLYNGRNFLQLLEGEAGDLAWVMERIRSDPRHQGLSVLDDLEAGERACPDWLMRHIRLLDRVEERRAAVDAELPAALDPGLRRLILNFAMLN